MPASVCALAPLDSPSHSAVRDFAILLPFTFRRQLNSSCANTYTLKPGKINDFMLEAVCGSGVVVVDVVVVVLCIETLTLSRAQGGGERWRSTSWNWRDFRKWILKHRSDHPDLDNVVGETIGLQVIWL